MPTAIDYWINWSIIGAFVGAISYLTRRTFTDALFTRMIDGVIGACVGGEIVRRWDASLVLSGTGLIGATLGSILFLLLLGRFRPA